MTALIALGVGGVAVLLADILWEGAEGFLRAVALAAVAAALFLPAAPGLPAHRLGRVLGDVAVASSAVAVLLPSPRAWRRRLAAYLAVLLWSAAGMVLLAHARDLLTLFLGVELLSLGLYALTAFGLDGRGGEAALKYLLLGGLASGFVLFGGALAYAQTGSLALAAWHGAVAGQALVAIGLGFKLALVPLHVWTPDVYEGAPTPVTAFMAVGTKAAAFAALARVAAPHVLPVVAALGVASMFGGYLLATPQGGLKRLLAYSSVAHAGTFVLALEAGAAALPAALLYVPAYGAATAGAFAVAGSVGDRLADYAGLARRRPWLAAAFGVCLLALASVPPTGVFFAKLLLLVGLVHAGHPGLAVLIVAATVLSLYPYFKIAALLVAPGGDAAAAAASAERRPEGSPQSTGGAQSSRMDWPTALVIACAAAIALGLGIFPGLIAG
jgi:NADH-quinone oxidoreductase subunit N